MKANPFAPLDSAGLNLRAVYRVDALPPALRATLPDTHHAQLILIGHHGPAFWHALRRSHAHGEHPMDDFSREIVSRWLSDLTGRADIHWLYPGNTPIGLQALGALAGWHHESPFKVGVHPQWGSWFAYRAAVFATTGLPETPLSDIDASPCATCRDAPCVSACPAKAVDHEGFALPACLNHRLEAGSVCADTCLARLACPLGTASRYPVAQITHMYRHSLTMIRAYRETSERS